MATYGVEGKVALVTGAGSGIGEATARLLAERGATVVVADLRAEAAEQVAADLVAGGAQALALAVDVADEAAVDQMVADTVARFGRLDAAVNNAGISGERVPVGDYPTASWRAVMSVNLDGVFFCTRAEVGAMRRGGGGAIVNMASILGAVGFANSVAYVAAKHGVVGLTKSAALEHAGDHIRVNAVGPGFIATPLVEGALSPEEVVMVGQLHPLGRLGTTAEVASLVAWLLSDQASFATGGYYPIDGGYLAQ
jgi:NAD(P)-dependent dehydrogenase (short-subunit alcohol dehydrogenase family)